MYEINNGTSIPLIGYGTWLIEQPIAKECVLNALKFGYSHIDSAQAYENEVDDEEEMRESKIERKDIYLTTKVAAEIKSYEKEKQSIDASLKRFNVSYIDLMLIHFPQSKQIWKSLILSLKLKI